MRLAILMFSLFVLTGCSGSGDNEKTDADYAGYTYANMEALVDTGLYDTALEILQERQRRGMGGIQELKLILRARLEKQDGIGAESIIDRLLAMGETPESLLIPTAKAYVIQTRYKEVLSLLTTDTLPEEIRQEAYLIIGGVLKAQKNIKGAREYYLSALKEDEDDFRGYLALALLEFETGQLDKAEALASEALARESSDAIVQYAVGVIARYKGEMEKAENYLLKAINLRSNNIAALVELAGIYIEQENFEAAEKQLDAVYSADPNNLMAQYYSALIYAEQGNLQEAEKLLILSQDLTQSYLPAARAYGLVSYDLGKYSTASRYLKQFLSAIPTDGRVRLALIDSLIKRGKSAEAMSYIEPVLAIAPDDINANLYAAAAMASAGNVQKALEFYEKAQTMMEGRSDTDPEMDTFLQTKVAISRFLTGDNAKAAEQLQKLYAGQPGSFDTLVLIANVHLEANDLKAVQTIIEKMDVIKPSSLEAFNFKGVLEYKAGNLEAAINHYDQALSINPEYFSAIKNRGLAYLAAKKPAKAKVDLVRAAEMNPADGQIQAFLGRAYLDMGQAESATGYLERAELAFPRSALVLTDHAEALGQLGYISSAVKKAKQAKKLAGSDGNLVAYIDELLNRWAAIEAEKKILEAEARAEIDAAVAKKREEERLKRALELEEKAQQEALTANEEQENTEETTEKEAPAP